MTPFTGFVGRKNCTKSKNVKNENMFMFDSFNQYFEFFTFLSENCVVSNSTTYVDPALMFQAKEEGKFKLIMFALGIRQ